MQGLDPNVKMNIYDTLRLRVFGRVAFVAKCAGGHQEIPPGATITIVISIPSVAEVATVITQYQGKVLGEEELARILTELEINVGRGSEAARRYQSPNKKVRNLYE